MRLRDQTKPRRSKAWGNADPAEVTSGRGALTLEQLEAPASLS